MMENISKKSKIMPKLVTLETKVTSNFNQRSTIRSYRSKLVDLIPLNQTILSDRPRSEKND
jgi:hypothetical protein